MSVSVQWVDGTMDAGQAVGMKGGVLSPPSKMKNWTRFYENGPAL